MKTKKATLIIILFTIFNGCLFSSEKTCGRGVDQFIGFIHLAFSVGSEDKVNALTAKLAEDGFEVLEGPRRTGDGYYESVVLDPENNRIEITV